MKLGIRGRLFATPLVLIVAVLGIAGPYAEHRLRHSLELRVRTQLLHQARAARERVLAAPNLSREEIQPVAARLGEALGSRVTVIAEDGTVLGDSELSMARLLEVENHRDRPEVMAARADGQGVARRYSRTLGTDMLYVAVALDHPAGRGVVRVAEPLSEVDAVVGSLRRGLLVAGLLGLVVAVGVGWLAAFLLSRQLRGLAESARAIAAGGRSRIEVTSSDELGAMAGSFNRMAEEIEHTVTALADERARFEAVLDSISGAVIALDAQKRITLINPAASELLGIGDDAVGRSLVDVSRGPVAAVLRRVAMLVLNLVEEAGPEQEASVDKEIAIGEQRLMARLAPRSDGQGWVLVMHDVTALRRLETIRRDFVANVSHELRTPVSIIRANAEALVDGAAGDPAHGPKMLAAVLRNAERLGAIIEELLSLSRLEAGKLEPKHEPVAVAGVVAAAVDSVAGPAAAKQTTIEVAMAAELEVVADSAVLEEILINLLDNAVKYTPEGSRVVIEGQRQGDRVRFEVCDNGPGLERRHRDRVFERFYRVDPGRSREMGGTGLGLSIVKHMVEAMGGTVGVAQASPHGAIFWFELPAP